MLSQLSLSSITTLATGDPAVSIIMPFDPVMSPKSGLENRLKQAKAKIENALMKAYPADIVLQVVNKLGSIITNLNFNINKKSIAIFVSPSTEKVFYIDMPVEEKVVNDDSFKMHHLVAQKKEPVQYLSLVLNAVSARIYMGEGLHSSRLLADMPYRFNKEPYRIQTGDAHKEQLAAVVRYIDQGLSILLKSYPYPVFVMGQRSVINRFKRLTSNDKAIVQYIKEDFDDANESSVRNAIKPFVDNWYPVKQAHLFNEVQQAQQEDKLVCGLQQVSACASYRNNKRLLIEESYMEQLNNITGKKTAPAFYLKDTIDHIIEKALESGADIAFVKDGLLKDYQHIVLVRK